MRILLLRRAAALLASSIGWAVGHQAINEKPSIINEYESGKAIPNGQKISKMERAIVSPPPPASASSAHISTNAWMRQHSCALRWLLLSSARLIPALAR